MTTQNIIILLQMMGKQVTMSPLFKDIYCVKPPCSAKKWKHHSSRSDHVIDYDLPDYLKFIAENT